MHVDVELRTDTVCSCLSLHMKGTTPIKYQGVIIVISYYSLVILKALSHHRSLKHYSYYFRSIPVSGLGATILKKKCSKFVVFIWWIEEWGEGYLSFWKNEDFGFYVWRNEKLGKTQKWRKNRWRLTVRRCEDHKKWRLREKKGFLYVKIMMLGHHSTPLPYRNRVRKATKRSGLGS